MNTPLGSFRIVSYLEGISFLLLLGVAMPLKYMLDMPMAVTVVGAIHGILFILYLLAIGFMMLKVRWSFITGFLALIASVIPFGPFIFDAKLLRQNH